ncbi:kinase-like domain-containing protein [Desarmillaria tabescens]|uniref:non-specific serine/threonine protein kinase n=1 Tax=Armillaria tabescens TaxID=1929756 RepID=A0AA39JQ78_ARMTA|nr:kinase-like domain-containing protein [Desarmillaria tabescens]KAK0444538.1 kinase-like domain-containing protein [Desarmillaria tabescens]
MFDDDDDETAALVSPDPTWQAIFHASNQVVLYNPTSHALVIRQSPQRTSRSGCPYCKRPLPPESQDDLDPEPHSRASNYFHLLSMANDTWSRPSTPPPIAEAESSDESTSAFSAEALANGYFKAFFTEESKLGMGANGSVYLCQHVLDGNPLGHFAVKKVAVGQSHSYLLNILREVRLLERLHHPNIITYHHSWLESAQFSSFGPRVPTLHILMQWAEGGSLDDFIDDRLGRETRHIHINPSGALNGTSATSNIHSRSARIRAYRAFQRASPEEKEQLRKRMNGQTQGVQTWTAVHLLSPEEVKSIFTDVVEGLAFLHDKSILHLDLKPGNVLLTWDEGKLIPRAMLSDFGTSRDMVNTSQVRSGNTGTLEYTSPESLPSPQTGLLRQVDSKSDMWSLGMILHKILFFKLPYHYAAAGDASEETLNSLAEGDKMDRLEQEVLNYPGFKRTPALVAAFEGRKLPRAYFVLLETLLNPNPSARPSCERVLTAIREGRLDPVKEPRRTRAVSATSLIQVVRRPSPEPTAEQAANVVVDDPEVPEEEKAPLLSLPAPDEEPPTTVAPIKRLKMTLVVRTAKSCILVVKMLNLATLCPEGHLRTVVFIIVLILAVGLWVSIVFGLLHVLVVQLGC